MVAPLAAKLLSRRYHEIFTHLTTDEKFVLYILARKSQRSSVAVEIGSFCGTVRVLSLLDLVGKGAYIV